MTVINFNTARPADFFTVLSHLKAAADMVRGMSRSQLDEFWAAAVLHDREADETDLAASMAFHLGEWECDVRDEWQINNSKGKA